MDFLSTDADEEPFFHLSNPSGPLSTAPVNPRRSGDRLGFDFRSDDVLPNYDFQPSRRSGSMNARSNSSPWLEEGSLNRQHRPSSITGIGSSVYLTGELSSTGRRELDMDSYNSQLVSAVERTMKKYADNILRVLEGMSGRLSQLELITQDLEQTVASIKVSVNEYHGEADGKLRMLDNRVMEMHRVLQILRDKQDIAEAHAELAKLQSSKIEAPVEKSIAGGSAINQNAESGQMPKQHQVPVYVAPNTTKPTYSIQPQVSMSHQQEAVAPNTSVVQLPPTSSQSLNTLPQQYFPVQAQFQQHELQQPHVQPVQQLLPSQEQIQHPGQGQLLPQQGQQLHVQPQSSVQQPLQSQQQIQQSLPQALQAQLQHTQMQQTMHQPAQMQQTMQQQAQGLQSMPQQGPLQPLQQQAQLLQLQQQTPGAQSQLEQAQPQVVSQRMQLQQPFPQQAPGQQPVQQLPHASHSTNTQLVTAQQAMQAQIVSQAQQMQQGPGQLQAQHLPVNGGSFQQYPRNNETQIYTSHPPGSLLQAPYVQGGYVAEPSYAPANLSSNQQQLSSISQQPAQMVPHNYNSHQRSSLSGTPLPTAQPTYEPNVTGHYSGPTIWTGQNPSAVPAARQLLPSAQPVQSEPFSARRNLPLNQSPLDGVVERVAAMGFSREEVRTVIKKLTEKGHSVDMNMVLDTLMNGRRES